MGNCIFPLTAENEPGFSGVFFPSFLKVTCNSNDQFSQESKKMDWRGFRFVVPSSTLGLKTCLPTKFSASKDNTHFLTLLHVYQYYYKGKQVLAAPKGTLSCPRVSRNTAVPFLDETSHLLGFTTKSCPVLFSQPLIDLLVNGSFFSTFSSHRPH